jgi:serine/threonine protein phosphatase PrpC
VASDGIWEFLNNQEVVEIIDRYYSENKIEIAADKLIERALKFWKSVNKKITFIRKNKL